MKGSWRLFYYFDIKQLQLLLYITTILYFLGMTLLILLDNKPAQSTIAWLFTAYFLPFIGFFIYIVAGLDFKRRKILHQRPEETFSRQLKSVLEQQKEILSNLIIDREHDVRKTIQLLLNSNHSILTLNNHCELFHHGSDFFDNLKEDLKQAKSFIHMEFFIWKSDTLGCEIRDILVEKARQGVEVRLIFDGVGCFWAMSRKYKRSLRKAGINYQIFLDPLKFFTSGFANYLNHRKIVIIDGHIGYLGGMNMADEYITGGKFFKYTRDSGMRFEGEISQQLQTVFATDWYNSCKEWLAHEKYFPDLSKPLSQNETMDKVPIQLACSGPDSDWYIIRQLYFCLIINANNEVYIQSPYFIPDEGIATALETAALAGVKVHIMMTGLPNNAPLWVPGTYTERIPYWAAESYFARMLRAGCKIYRYDRGYLHCKTITVDEQMTSVGTCNMDVRSFELDYEVNAMIYDPGYAKAVKEQFYKDLEYCKEITLEDVKTKSIIFRLRNSILRIFSPLL